MLQRSKLVNEAHSVEQDKESSIIFLLSCLSVACTVVEFPCAACMEHHCV